MYPYETDFGCGHVTSFFGIEDWIPGKYQTPGAKVPDPLGFHRARDYEVTEPMRSFAWQVLKIANPKKLPQGKIIGKRIQGVVENTPIIGQIEWHLDNHPPRPSQGYGPMEGPNFYHMGVSLFLPDNPQNIGFGWFGSKIAHAASHFASNIVKSAGHEIGVATKPLQGVEGAISGTIKHIPVIGGPIHSILDKTFHIAMAPTNMVIAISEGGGRIDKVVLGQLKEQLKDFQQLAPYAEMVVSLVPGVGQGVGAAIAAGVALSEGQPISRILKAGLIGAMPGGPLVQAAVRAGVETIQHVAKGDRFNFATFAQTAGGAASDALGLPSATKNALVTGIAITGQIVKGKAIDKALTDNAISALPLSDSVKRAMTEASTLSLELAHGNRISIDQTARIATLTANLPSTSPLHGNILEATILARKNPDKSSDIMQAALHSGLGDTLVSIGAQQLHPDVQRAIKSGTALGSAVIYQEHRGIALSKVSGNLIESGIQQSKNHPVFAEARKLAASKNTARGFDHGNGLLQHEVGMFDVITTRERLEPSQRLGFDIASSARIGSVANPRPQNLSSAAHAGYAISMGMQSHNPEQKAGMMQAIQLNPSASVGATLAIKEVAAERASWRVRFLRFFGFSK